MNIKYITGGHRMSDCQNVRLSKCQMSPGNLTSKKISDIEVSI